MAATIRDAVPTTIETASTNIVVVNSGSVQVGDLLVVPITSPNGDVITPPSGWSLEQDDVYSTNPRCRIYTRIATSADVSASDYTWTSNASRAWGTGIVVVADANQSAPVHVKSGQGNASSTNGVAPSVAPTIADGLLLTFHSFVIVNPTVVSQTAPGGMTELIDTSTTTGTPSNRGVAAYAQQLSASGATGTRTSTLSSASNNVGQSLVIAPARLATGGATFTLTATGAGTTGASGVTGTGGATFALQATGTGTSSGVRRQRRILVEDLPRFARQRRLRLADLVAGGQPIRSGGTAGGVVGAGGATFALAATGAGTASSGAVSGTGGATFTLTATGFGSTVAGAISGSGGALFAFTAQGTGTYVAPARTGSGGATFTLTAGGTGSTVAGAVSGSGGATITLTATGLGTYVPPQRSGSGGATFTLHATGNGTTTVGAIAGSGGVTLTILAYGTGVFVSLGSGQLRLTGAVRIKGAIRGPLTFRGTAS